MAVRYERIRIGIVLTIAAALGAASASQAAQVRGACGQITAACQRTGFVQGGAKAGNGLQVDCVDPIMSRATPTQNAGKTVPHADPQIVAGCKGSNPEFGQRPTAATAAPPPPAAAVVQRAPSQFSS